MIHYNGFAKGVMTIIKLTICPYSAKPGLLLYGSKYFNQKEDTSNDCGNDCGSPVSGGYEQGGV